MKLVLIIFRVWVIKLYGDKNGWWFHLHVRLTLNTWRQRKFSLTGSSLRVWVGWYKTVHDDGVEIKKGFEIKYWLNRCASGTPEKGMKIWMEKGRSICEFVKEVLFCRLNYCLSFSVNLKLKISFLLHPKVLLKQTMLRTIITYFDISLNWSLPSLLASNTCS